MEHQPNGSLVYIPIDDQTRHVFPLTTSASQQDTPQESLSSDKFHCMFILKAVWFVLGVALMNINWSTIKVTNRLYTGDQEEVELGLMTFVVTTISGQYPPVYRVESSECESYSSHCEEYADEGTTAFVFMVLFLVFVGLWEGMVLLAVFIRWRFGVDWKVNVKLCIWLDMTACSFNLTAIGIVLGRNLSNQFVNAQLAFNMQQAEYEQSFSGVLWAMIGFVSIVLVSVCCMSVSVYD